MDRGAQRGAVGDMCGALAAPAAPSAPVGGGLRGVFQNIAVSGRSGAAGQASAGPCGGLRPARRARAPPGTPMDRGARLGGAAAAGAGVGATGAGWGWQAPIQKITRSNCIKYPQPLPSAPPLPRAHLARAARQPLPTVQPRIEATAGSCGPGRVARRPFRAAPPAVAPLFWPKMPENGRFSGKVGTVRTRAAVRTGPGAQIRPPCVRR